MAIRSVHSRKFIPGTTGWTEDHLNDPSIERRWELGRYEIVEGVLTKMPPAYLEGSFSLRRLVRQIENHLEAVEIPGEFGFELDLVVNKIRVPRVDAVFVTPEQLRRQAEAQARLPRKSKMRYGRLRVAPELVIESTSQGHELHDRRTKRQWYREFCIPNYWIMDPKRKSLECLQLVQGEYATDIRGENDDVIMPSMFPGLKIQVGKIWV